MIKNLVGQIFGDLTVVELAPERYRNQAQWVCACHCGQRRTVPAPWLRQGKATHCGCKTHRAIPVHVGDRFGQLEVLRKATKTCYWICKCDCGKEFSVYQSNLLSGKSTACRRCGHFRMPTGEAAFNRLLRSYTRQAKERGIPFLLSRDQFRTLVTGECAYCGGGPAQVVYSRQQRSPFTYNGIDRVDNDQPYTFENCVSCCGLCNHMKVDLTQQAFFEHLTRIVLHCAVLDDEDVSPRHDRPTAVH